MLPVPEKEVVLLPSRLLSGLVVQIREIIDEEFGIVDSKGVIAASSQEAMAGNEFGPAQEVLQTGEDIAVRGLYTFKKIYLRNRLEYMVYIKGTDKVHLNYLKLIAAYLTGIRHFHDEKYDRNSFVKELLEETVKPSDIALRAKELHIEANNVSRVVLTVRSAKTEDTLVEEVLRELFPAKLRDFIIMIDDKTTVLVKELNGEEEDEAGVLAHMIVDALNSETLIQASVGIGSAVRDIADIGRSYRESLAALDVGRIFENEKNVLDFNKLGIGRLIYRLPAEPCRMFLDEIFKDGSYEAIEGEYLATIQKFFENNLNISLASRQMFVHRNTLVYRLEKIQKLTGLDLTRFDDAVVLKLAILVKKHLAKLDGRNL